MGGSSIGHQVGQGHASKGQRHKDHPIGEACNASRFGLQLFHTVLQFIHGRGIRIEPTVNAFTDAGPK